MPVGPQGDPRPFHALSAEFPIHVEPIRIANHDHQPVLGKVIPVGNAVERQVFRLGQFRLDLLQAPHRSYVGGGRLVAVSISVRRSLFSLGVLYQGVNQLVLLH